MAGEIRLLSRRTYAATHGRHGSTHRPATRFALKEEGWWQSHEYQRYVKWGTPEIGAEAAAKGWSFVLVGAKWGNGRSVVAMSDTEVYSESA